MSTPPPIPREPNVPLQDTTVLKLGDVVQIAVRLSDKITGERFWWKRFACVVQLPKPFKWGWATRFYALTLKMHPTQADLREIDLDDENQVVMLLPEHMWPQGVVAMRMKHIHLGNIKLGE